MTYRSVMLWCQAGERRWWCTALVVLTGEGCSGIVNVLAQPASFLYSLVCSHIVCFLPLFEPQADMGGSKPPSFPNSVSELSIIGNCSHCAMIDIRGSIEFACLPRWEPFSPPPPPHFLSYSPVSGLIRMRCFVGSFPALKRSMDSGIFYWTTSLIVNSLMSVTPLLW